MAILIVVNNPAEWPLKSPGVDVISARSYISEIKYTRLRGCKVFNLCRSYRYQSLGYYVSLLAEARGHRPMPSITTIQDLKSQSMTRLAGDDLEELMQQSLSRLGSRAQTFTLSIYFGKNTAKRYDRLAGKLFNSFPAPLLRAQFEREKKWELRGVHAVALNEVPATHREFLLRCAAEYFSGKRRPGARRDALGYEMAILHDPAASESPSDPRTIEKFIRAARRVGIHAQVIGKEDSGKIPEFDALFIRETTAVNHHTYRFARKAQREGLVVIDDPESIVRCCNKVFLAEALEANGIRAPRTLIVHKDNIEDIPLYVGFPCVLKQPDSAFSMGVTRVDKPEDLERKTLEILARSDLVIAQEWLPSEYDWRVGVLDGKPLFVAKYHMVKGHWQIAQVDKRGKRMFGRVEAMAVKDAPPRVINAAVRSAKEFGNGLYGVDLKQIGSRVYVIEVNDNPNIDAGYEDVILKDALYDRVIGVFLDRLNKQRTGPRRKKAPTRKVRLDLSSPERTRGRLPANGAPKTARTAIRR